MFSPQQEVVLDGELSLDLHIDGDMSLNIPVDGEAGTPTYSDGQTSATLSTASGTLVEGDDYIITLNGDEYWFTAINVDWGGFTFIGAEGYLWGTSGEQLYPCLIYDGPSEYNNLMLLVYDGSAGTPVTIKVEKIELS